MATLDDWNDATRRAIGRAARGDDGSCLFFEQRDDARLELNDPGFPPILHRSRASGLAWREGFGRYDCLSDPSLDDAETLVASRAARPTGSGPPAMVSDAAAIEERIAEAEALLTRLVSAAAGHDPNGSVRVGWVAGDQQVVIARPGKGAVTDRRRGARLRIEGCVGEREQQGTAVVEHVAHGDEKFDADSIVGDSLRALLERARRRIDARPARPGERDVVIAPAVGGVLVHELVGHALEADTVLAGRSWLSRWCEVGGRLPHDLIVVDDPRRGRVRWRVDDEGESARPVALVRGGAVHGWMHDLRTARRTSRPPTGHGRRSSYREPIRPRMGCTFIAAGRHSPDEAFVDIADGIFIRRMEAARTDVGRGRAVFRVTEADRIVAGHLAEPLTPQLVFVDGPELFRAIRAIGVDLAMDACAGVCLRDGQPMSTSVGGPTFRTRLTIGNPDKRIERSTGDEQGG